MTIVARIDETELTTEDLVRYLKINNKFDALIEDMITEYLATVEASKLGVDVTDVEVQQEADLVRRSLGLHRAQDTFDFLDNIGLTVEGFEQSLRDTLLRRKAIDAVCSETAVEEHYELHSPKYESVEISRILVDSEGKAREAIAILEEEPEEFASMAKSLSLDQESADKGGQIGTFSRGELQSEMESKIFNGAVGEVMGPFDVEDGKFYEIYLITKRHTPKLDLATKKAIAKTLYDQWIDERLQEHRVEIL